MRYLKTLAFTLATLAALPATLHAQQMAYTAKDINMRAGPARDYPVVAVLKQGVQMSVQDCLPDYQWCDVEAGSVRGWVYAGNILYPYQGNNVPVLTYGSAIGIGIGAFVIGDYWDRYYRGRPWYGQRQHWVNRPPSSFGHRAPHGPGPGFRPGPPHTRPPGPGGFPPQHRPGIGQPPPRSHSMGRPPNRGHNGNPGGHQGPSRAGAPGGHRRP